MDTLERKCFMLTMAVSATVGALVATAVIGTALLVLS